MATRRYHQSQRQLDAWEGTLRRLVRLLIVWPLKLALILLLLLIDRKSLALYLWGRGWVMRKIAKRHKATKAMYNSTKWKKTRKPVYWRNKNQLGGGSEFVCEATGYRSTNLGDFHVDHQLSRADFPMIAYAQTNLRLVRADVNMAKRDKLCGWSLVKFIFRKRIR